MYGRCRLRVALATSLSLLKTNSGGCHHSLLNQYSGGRYDEQMTNRQRLCVLAMIAIAIANTNGTQTAAMPFHLYPSGRNQAAHAHWRLAAGDGENGNGWLKLSGVFVRER